MYSWYTDGKWICSWHKVQRVNNLDGKRFIEYFQLVYDYGTEEFSVNFKQAETGVATFIGTMEGPVITGGLRPKYESLVKKSFVLGKDFVDELDEVINHDHPDDETEPEKPTEDQPVEIIVGPQEWRTVGTFTDGFAKYRVQRYRR